MPPVRPVRCPGGNRVSPQGYRKEGSQRGARLVPSEEPLAGVGLSEAEVIRRIYHMVSKSR